MESKLTIYLRKYTVSSPQPIPHFRIWPQLKVRVWGACCVHYYVIKGKIFTFWLSDFDAMLPDSCIRMVSTKCLPRQKSWTKTIGQDGCFTSLSVWLHERCGRHFCQKQLLESALNYPRGGWCQGPPPSLTGLAPEGGDNTCCLVTHKGMLLWLPIDSRGVEEWGLRAPTCNSSLPHQGKNLTKGLG